MSLAVGGFLDGGGGSNTLLLNDPSTDGSNVSFDLAKGGNVGPGGVYAQNFTNLSYYTNNDGGAKTGSTTFRLEGGQNTIDYTYSSGANTVYNTGGVATVTGGTGTDVVVGGTGTTTLTSLGGTDYLYGGSGTDLMMAANATGGTDYLYAGSGSETFNGGGGTGNEYMYGAGGTDAFNGGSGTNVLVEGTHSDVFHGGAGTDYIYGSSGASQVYGGSGTDFVYTGASNQYFYSGTGKEYFYEQSKTMTNGRLDILDNFQAQGAGGKGTFIFEPAADANSTTFVASNGGHIHREPDDRRLRRNLRRLRPQHRPIDGQGPDLLQLVTVHAERRRAPWRSRQDRTPHVRQDQSSKPQLSLSSETMVKNEEWVIARLPSPSHGPR